MAVRVGFDIGGTFTDFVLVDEADRRIALGKVPTTPWDLARGVIDGLRELLATAGVEPTGVGELIHATTVAANAILERRGARTALITTEGFRDVLLLGRQKRYETYDLKQGKVPPLLRRRDIYTVRERLDASGREVTPVETGGLEDLAARLRERSIASVAISLLHAYANPAHEHQVQELLRERLPGVAFSCSADISPRQGEYERTSTVVANAYVKPVVAGYLARLGAAFAESGIGARFFVMQSNGGLSTPELVSEQPVRIVESGPAAGVLMAAAVGRACGLPDLLTLDMGGTTAKVGIVIGGEPVVSDSFEVDRVGFRPGSGLPLSVPVIDLLEIGAGGGSVATAHLGTVRVGPESAGSEPGPVCYSRGGRACTVTDANLVLGYLDPDYFLGGRMRLDTEAARAAISDQIGGPLGLDAGRAAWGVHAVANSNMERALRVMSIERGHDPRSFALLAFGGAGPLHACRLARALAIPRVLVPPGAGVGSAIGLLEAGTRFDLSASRTLPLDDARGPEMKRIFDRLSHRLAGQFRIERTGDLVWSWAVWMRYAGQGHELRVELPPDTEALRLPAEARGRFEALYERTYGYRQGDAGVEIVHWGVSCRAGSAGDLLVGPSPPTPTGDALKGVRPAYFPEFGGYGRCARWDRYRLGCGDRVEGPAVIEEREATTLLLPGDRAWIDARGVIVVEVGHGDGR